MADVRELGRRVKQKFPGEYDHVDDAELGRKVKAKYPNDPLYSQFTDTPAPQAQTVTPGFSIDNLVTGARGAYQDYIQAPIYALAEAGQEAVKGNFTPARQVAEGYGRGLAKLYAAGQLPPGAALYQDIKLQELADEQNKRRVNNPAFRDAIIARSKTADRAAADPSISGRVTRFVGGAPVAAAPAILAGTISGGSIPAIAATAALQSAADPENAALNVAASVLPLPAGRAARSLVGRGAAQAIEAEAATLPRILTGPVENMARLRAASAPSAALEASVAKAVERSPWQDSVLAYYRANLLTNPVGRVADLGSTVINQFADAAARPVAAAVDVVVSKLTGARSITGPSLAGTGRALGSVRQGLSDAKGVLKTGAQAIDSGADDVLYGSEIRSGLGKLADNPINGVFRVLGALDAPFRRFGYARNLYDRARTAAINEGKRGPELGARVRELLDDQGIIRAAVRDGEAAVLSEPNKISSWLASQTYSSPNARLAIGLAQPFMRIPLNAVLKAADFSGVGGIKALYKVARGVGRKARGQRFFSDLEEQRVFSQNVAAGSFAPAAFLLGMELESQGRMQGYFYTSKRDFPNGKVPTSVNIGGENYDINRLGGFIAAPMLIGATYNRLRKQDATKANALLRSFSGLVQTAPALGYYGVPAKLGRLLTSDEPGDVLLQEAGSTASGFIPASGALGAAAKALDPEKRRETEGFTGPIMNRIPGLRQRLPVKEGRRRK